MAYPRFGVLMFIILALAGCRSEPVAHSSLAPAAGALEEAGAMARLKAGNHRYVAGTLEHPRQSPERRTQLRQGQEPFAVILGCADSRTPPEVLFDQGLGDLFVLRVAGNVLNNEILGSMEYAVDHLGTRVIVVLGHQGCGAVKAAQGAVRDHSEAHGHVQSLVTAITPAIEATAGGDLEAAIKMNVLMVARTVRSSIPSANGPGAKVSVVGAYYDLDSGEVTFLPAETP